MQRTRISPFGIPVVPLLYRRQIKLSSSTFGSVILSQSSIPLFGKTALPPSTTDFILHSGLLLIINTLLRSTPQSLAALQATSFASSLQNIKFDDPCFICRESS